MYHLCKHPSLVLQSTSRRMYPTHLCLLDIFPCMSHKHLICNMLKIKLVLPQPSYRLIFHYSLSQQVIPASVYLFRLPSPQLFCLESRIMILNVSCNKWDSVPLRSLILFSLSTQYGVGKSQLKNPNLLYLELLTTSAVAALARFSHTSNSSFMKHFTVLSSLFVL